MEDEKNKLKDELRKGLDEDGYLTTTAEERFKLGEKSVNKIIDNSPEDIKIMLKAVMVVFTAGNALDAKFEKACNPFLEENFYEPDYILEKNLMEQRITQFTALRETINPRLKFWEDIEVNLTKAVMDVAPKGKNTKDFISGSMKNVRPRAKLAIEGCKLYFNFCDIGIKYINEIKLIGLENSSGKTREEEDERLPKLQEELGNVLQLIDVNEKKQIEMMLKK